MKKKLLVDIGSLFEAVPHSTRLLGPLTACQVHQANLAHLLSGHLAR